MKPLIAFCSFVVALVASIVCCAETPASDTMEFLGYTGYETRQLTLMSDNTYLARWDSDTGNKGSAFGSWELVGNEIRLTPKSETGRPMMGGPMRVLILKEGNGHKALLLKQEEDDPKRRKILLFLIEKKRNKLPATTPITPPRVPPAVRP